MKPKKRKFQRDLIFFNDFWKFEEGGKKLKKMLRKVISPNWEKSEKQFSQKSNLPPSQFLIEAVIKINTDE